MSINFKIQDKMESIRKSIIRRVIEMTVHGPSKPMGYNATLVRPMIDYEQMMREGLHDEKIG